MNTKTKNYPSLVIWILGLLLVSWGLGALTDAGLGTWYIDLNRSQLTPPSYVFGPVWTILYIFIAISGWWIFHKKSFIHAGLIKSLYIIQLILNWMWTPLFFYYHLPGLALLCLFLIDIAVAILIYACCKNKNLTSVAKLMIPYFAWILFATYLNWFIYINN